MANSVTPPDPKIPLLYFIFLSLIYGILSVTNILNIKNEDGNSYENKVTNISFNKNNTVINIIYILFLVTGTYFINVNLYKKFCSNLDSVSTPYSKLIIITLFPWIIIFGILYFVLEIFPGWIKPFSNTIGYFVVNVLGVENQLNKILIYKESDAESDKGIIQAINNINKDRIKFINELDSDGVKYIDFIKKMITANLFKEDNYDAYAQLYKYIIIKDVIGKITWYILAGSLIASITYNYIINLSCSKSDDAISNMLSQYDDYIDNMKLGNKWKLITQPNGGKDITDETDVVKLIDKFGDRFETGQPNVNITAGELFNTGIIRPLDSGGTDPVYIKVNNSDNSKLLYYQLKE